MPHFRRNPTTGKMMAGEFLDGTLHAINATASGETCCICVRKFLWARFCNSPPGLPACDEGHTLTGEYTLDGTILPCRSWKRRGFNTCKFFGPTLHDTPPPTAVTTQLFSGDFVGPFDNCAECNAAPCCIVTTPPPLITGWLVTFFGGGACCSLNSKPDGSDLANIQLANLDFTGFQFFVPAVSGDPAFVGELMVAGALRLNIATFNPPTHPAYDCTDLIGTIDADLHIGVNPTGGGFPLETIVGCVYGTGPFSGAIGDFHDSGTVNHDSDCFVVFDNKLTCGDPGDNALVSGMSATIEAVCGNFTASGSTSITFASNTDTKTFSFTGGTDDFWYAAFLDASGTPTVGRSVFPQVSIDVVSGFGSATLTLVANNTTGSMQTAQFVVGGLLVSLTVPA